MLQIPLATRQIPNLRKALSKCDEIIKFELYTIRQGIAVIDAEVETKSENVKGCIKALNRKINLTEYKINKIKEYIINQRKKELEVDSVVHNAKDVWYRD